MRNARSEVDVGTRAFLVEHYWPGVTAQAFGQAAAAVRASAEALAREGLNVRFLHSTLVPDDQAAYCVLVAESPATVERVYARADVTFDRVLDAVQIEGSAAGDVLAAATKHDKE